MKCIESSRLILRTWKETDVQIFLEINQDPKVIEFLRELTLDEVQEFMIRANNLYKQYKFCLWACELKVTQELIGFIGINIPKFTTHFTPCASVAWRLASAHWGKGYATEGAEASIKYGFEVLKLKEILSFAHCRNFKSRNVMEKIGMIYSPEDDFRHPDYPLDHRLSEMVLYKLKNSNLENC